MVFFEGFIIPLIIYFSKLSSYKSTDKTEG